MSAHDDYLAEKDAWAAYMQAMDDWKRRDAPSVGARAKAIARTLLFPPSYIDRVEYFIGLFLSEPQMAERRGFMPRRRTLSEANPFGL